MDKLDNKNKEMSIIHKILYKLGLKGEVKKPVPTWEQVLTPYVT